MRGYEKFLLLALCIAFGLLLLKFLTWAPAIPSAVGATLAAL
jgi:hypothetical protein